MYPYAESGKCEDIPYTIGFSYKAICVLLKLLPCRLANWAIGKLYA